MNACKGCGALIIWGKNEKGKNIPFDPKPVVYSVAPFEGQMIAVIPEGRVPGERFMISHFYTCPKADDFSHKNKSEVSQS